MLQQHQTLKSFVMIFILRQVFSINSYRMCQMFACSQAWLNSTTQPNTWPYYCHTAQHLAILLSHSQTPGHITVTQPNTWPYYCHTAQNLAILLSHSPTPGHITVTQSNTWPYYCHTVQPLAILLSHSPTPGHITVTQPNT